MNYRIARKISKVFPFQPWRDLRYTAMQIHKALMKTLGGDVAPTLKRIRYHLEEPTTEPFQDHQPKVKVNYLKAQEVPSGFAATPIQGETPLIHGAYFGMDLGNGESQTVRQVVNIPLSGSAKYPEGWTSDSFSSAHHYTDLELPKSLTDLTLPELKAEAKNRGLKGYSTLKKADLIALLEA